MTKVHETALRIAGDRSRAAEQNRRLAHLMLTKAIRAADKANMPKVEIARLAGVSRQTVHNILNR